MGKRLLTFFVEEWFLFLALLGFLVGIVLTGRFPTYTEGDFEILFILFVFLALTRALDEVNLTKYLAFHLERGGFVSLKLVLATFFLSTFLTNDIALLAIVPITLRLRSVNVAKLVVLETLAANAGSAFSPLGNPQNIFIYHFYGLNLLQFVKTMLPFSLFFLILLLLMTPKETETEQNEVPTPSLDTRRLLFLLPLFSLFVLSALKLLHIYLGVIPLLYLLVFQRGVFKRVDYPLLATFFFFFGFTDNFSHLLRLHIESPYGVFFSSLLLSQIISNVPATLLLADFTHLWEPLLWGVNAGGFGTLVASMANLIAYRLYTSSGGRKSEFLKSYHLGGFIFLLLSVLLFVFLHSDAADELFAFVWHSIEELGGSLLSVFRIAF